MLKGDKDLVQGKTEAAIKNFSPFYSRQYSVAFCNHVRSEVEQQRDLTSQFLKTKPPLDPGTVLYEAELCQFAEDIKKWKERYVVVKNDFAVESYENKEAYQRGAAPKSRILPAGGKVLTSEEEYNLLSDRHFPDPLASNEKESTPPFVVPPKEFPVYLWQPFLRHGYFCFQEATEQKKFHALLSDCIRHLNQASTELKPAVRTPSEGEEGMAPTATENLLSASLCVMVPHVTASGSQSEGR
ncbi:Protein Niban [Myotis brandtii]|uniref:Protein Niban n=1 Tax=Myotis brandtii TaxID=109478 RepID=S7P288_MYOBR|nr:Protein Niban [Myotis brandtii]